MGEGATFTSVWNRLWGRPIGQGAFCFLFFTLYVYMLSVHTCKRCHIAYTHIHTYNCVQSF